MDKSESDRRSLQKLTRAADINPSANHPVVAREGWLHIVIVVALTLGAHYYAGWMWALPLWLVTLFVVQFFRDPPRAIPNAPRSAVCPADGRVVAAGPDVDPFLKRPSQRVSIFMNAFNVHSNRSPVAGKVMEAWYHAGTFVNAALAKASLDNERNALWIRTDGGADVVVVQVAGLIARRILCYVRPGSPIAQGERYGFIRFGSRVDIYLPEASRLRVALGDKVKGGTDIIADLVSSS